MDMLPIVSSGGSAVMGPGSVRKGAGSDLFALGTADGKSSSC